MFTLESPNPPPDFVAYTEGVLFNISGNSWLPNFSWISAALIVETATGVFLLFAISTVVDFTTTSSISEVLNTTEIVPKSWFPSNDTAETSNPRKETTTVPLFSLETILKLPSSEVFTVVAFPLTLTIALAKGLFALSVTLPVTVDWAKTIDEDINNKVKNQ